MAERVFVPDSPCHAAEEHNALSRLAKQVHEIDLDKVSWHSIMFQYYLSPLVKLGASKGLDPEDVPKHRRSDCAETVANQLDLELQKARQNPNSSVWWTSTRAFWGPLARGGASQLLADICQFLGPFVVEQLVAYFEDEDKGLHPSKGRGFLFAVLLALVTIGASSIGMGRFYNIAVFCIRVRVAIMQLLFEKVLSISPRGMKDRTIGQLLNLVSNDSYKFSNAGDYSPELYVAPLSIIACVVLMWIRLGVVAIIAVVLLALLFPMQLLMAYLIRENQSEVLTNTDHRIKLVNEMIQAIRVIKLYAWEGAVRKAIASARELEIRSIRKGLILRFVNITLLFLWPCVVLYCTFVYISAHENTLTSAKVFLVLSFLNVIRYSIILLPYCHQAFVEVSVSSKRVKEFLTADPLPPPPPTSPRSLVTQYLDPIDEERPAGDLEDQKLQTLSDQALPPERGPLLNRLRLHRRRHQLSQRTPHFTVNSASFYWSRGETPILSSIDLKIQPGELVGVIGPVGVGKSSLLLGLLGEMIVTSGVDGDPSDHYANCPLASMRGRVGYLPQDPWILNATVEANITLELPFDADKFARVVEAAALGPDLAVLPNGGSTRVGDDGVNLSGGQRSRIALARLLYRAEQLDVYLLDDPLSAVDFSVGQHLFEKSLMSELRHKTRIVTLNSHLHLLPKFDRIIVLGYPGIGSTHENAPSVAAVSAEVNEPISVPLAASNRQDNSQTAPGSELRSPRKRQPATIIAMGTLDELQQQHINFTKFERCEGYLGPVYETCSVSTISEYSSDAKASEFAAQEDDLRDKEDPDPEASEEKGRASESESCHQGLLILDTYKGAKSVAIKHYLQYFGAGTKGLSTFAKISFLILTVIGAQAFRTITDLWFTLWGKDSPSSNQSDHSANWWQLTTLVWVLGCFVLIILRSLAGLIVATHASRTLHDTNFEAVLRAPMAWFDVTSVGNIVNLFGKDCETIDTIVPESLFESMQQICTMLAMIALAIAVSPFFILLLVVLIALMYYCQQVFRPVATQLKRLESISIGPLYASFASTLRGASSIRAFALESEFIDRNRRLLDKYSRFSLYYTLVQRWLSWRLDAIASGFVLGVSCLAVAFSGSVNSNVASLAIVTSMQLLGLLQWNVRLVIMTEGHMTSVERLNELRSLPSEPVYLTEREVSNALSNPDNPMNSALLSQPPHNTLEHRLPLAAEDETSLASREARLHGWPWQGKIEFRNVRMRYHKNQPAVLNQLSFVLPAGKKMGVVGRTGAGKSSLALTLFRMVDIDNGAVLIDDVDIRNVGIGDLRSRMTIISQQLILFSGTVRYNLDPFGSHSDQELLQALSHVGLIDKVASMAGGLDATVAEFGSNFSSGEQQLLCIARALLRGCNILVLDEATAAVDPFTDAAIQATLRKHFSHCTIITIAHRLDTIVDYDYILVLGPVASDPQRSHDQHELNSSVLEFGEPEELLRRAGGHLQTMALQAGEAVYQNLLARASRARQREGAFA